MSLIRVALLVLAVYLLWKAGSRLVRSFGKMSARSVPPGGPGHDRPADELVQDPVCKLYVPRREAILLRGRDGDIFFCSTKCRDLYVARQDGQRV